MKKIIALILCTQIALGSAAFAQDNSADDLVKSTQQDIIMVGSAGLAGAVLGLSTLSFVDEPSKNLSNIWTGAAIGVIAGVIFVAYNSAQKNQEDLESSTDFKTFERVAWHHSQDTFLTTPKVQFGTQIWGTSF
jgi:hypothetical protein